MVKVECKRRGEKIIAMTVGEDRRGEKRKRGKAVIVAGRERKKREAKINDRELSKQRRG